MLYKENDIICLDGLIIMKGLCYIMLSIIVDN